MVCDCFEFFEDLFNLSQDIRVIKDKKQQWEEFEQFCVKYKRNNESRLLLFGERCCSPNICSFLKRKLNQFVHSDTSPLTLIVDLLAIFCFERYCARKPVRRLRDAFFFSNRETIRAIAAIRQYRLGLDYTKMLLDFGFLSSLPADTPLFMERFESEFATIIMEMGDGDISYEDSFSVREKVMEMLIKGNIYSIKNKENWKRMFLVTMALRGVLLSVVYNNDSLAEDFINALRIYFTATPDALISVFEARSILYASFLIMKKLFLFDKCCQKFDWLMPECPAKMQPRKLTHLARCQIRQNLKRIHLPLHLAIEKLCLPKILTSFLLGEVLDISYREDISIQTSVTLSELELIMSEKCASKNVFS